MNRRSFLKFVGLAPVVPGLAVETVSHEQFIWSKFIEWKTETDWEKFRAEHSHPNSWRKVKRLELKLKCVWNIPTENRRTK